MKLKEMLIEDLGKFSNAQLISAFHRFLGYSDEPISPRELIKLIHEFYKRNISFIDEIDEMCCVGELPLCFHSSNVSKGVLK